MKPEKAPWNQVHYTTELDRTAEPAIVCVVDLSNERGGCSVTNAAEQVTATCFDKYGDLPIVYQDSAGRWDGLQHDKGRFTGFVSIGANTQETAVELARRRHA